MLTGSYQDQDYVESYSKNKFENLVLLFGFIGRRFIKYFDTIYLLTAIVLTPGDSSAVHIYTQTVHRTTSLNRLHRTKYT